MSPLSVSTVTTVTANPVPPPVYRSEARIHILYEHLEQWLQLVSADGPPAKSVHIVITEHTFKYETKVDLLPLLQLNARFQARRIFEFNIYDSLTHLYTAWANARRFNRLNWLLEYHDDAWLGVLRGTNTRWRPLVAMLLNIKRGVLELVFESDLSSCNPVPPLEQLHYWSRSVRFDKHIWFAAR
jgi:hypothetical protein